MTPLERAAKALYEDVRKDFAQFCAEWETLSPHTQSTYVAAVRAALATLMEPDGRMQQAAWAVEPSWEKSYTIWQAMLKKVISGG